MYVDTIVQFSTPINRLLTHSVHIITVCSQQHWCIFVGHDVMKIPFTSLTTHVVHVNSAYTLCTLHIFELPAFSRRTSAMMHNFELFAYLEVLNRRIIQIRTYALKNIYEKLHLNDPQSILFNANYFNFLSE